MLQGKKTNQWMPECQAENLRLKEQVVCLSVQDQQFAGCGVFITVF